jgi:hypothetical protein
LSISVVIQEKLLEKQGVKILNLCNAVIFIQMDYASQYSITRTKFKWLGPEEI